MAGALPWHTLRQEALRVPASERPDLLASLLLGTGGLLPSEGAGKEGLAAGTRGYVRRLEGWWQRLGPRPSATSVSWHLFQVRPENHPLRRVAGAAQFLTPYVEEGLARGLEKLLWDEEGARAASHVEVPAVGPWARGQDSSKPSRRPPALIGKGRARDLLVNVLLPFYHAQALTQERPPLQERALGLYHRAPLLEENAITREMRRHLLAPDSLLVQGARRQQGLIHLYKALFARQG